MTPVPRDDRPIVFISHITEESPVATTLQRYIEEAFAGKIKVFVSSDRRSVEGGVTWWEHIRATLKEVRVVLLLLSDESVSRPWINYEAGVGDGSDARVIPIAIRSFHFGKLDFPLRGFNGRPIGDLEGILLDISSRTGLVSQPHDTAQFTEEIQKAEARVTYKSLVLVPVIETKNGRQILTFELSNRGNTDIDLLSVEAFVPRALQGQGWAPSGETNCLDAELLSDDPANPVWHLRYSTNPGQRIPRLPPVITRSMGTRLLKELRFVLKELSEEDWLQMIRYQAHARDYETTEQSTRLMEIPRRN